MRNALLSASLLSMLCATPTAFTSPWYLDIGVARVTGDLPDSAGRDLRTQWYDTDETTDAWRIAGGYQLSEGWTVEFGYIDFGKQSLSLSSSFYSDGTLPPNYSPFSSAISLDELMNPQFEGASDTTDPVENRNQPVLPDTAAAGSTASIETQGLRLAFTGTWPVSEGFALQLQAGAAVLRHETRIDATRPVLVPDPDPPLTYAFEDERYTEKDTVRQTRGFLGFGALLAVSDSVNLRLFYEAYLDTEALGIEADQDTYNLSLQYHF